MLLVEIMLGGWLVDRKEGLSQRERGRKGKVEEKREMERLTEREKSPNWNG